MAWRDDYSGIRTTPDMDLTPDTFKILLATDIHLGCYEEDHIRGNDSFEAFEEVLMFANYEQVDFVLLGGDLFHENKPSRPTLEKCMVLIRKYCFGKRDLLIYRLTPSDREEKPLNYEDPDLNISLPIFTIHGNHDDPTGPGSLSELDNLSINGLINYFGKSSQVDRVEVEPLVLRKGESTLALYGLGAMRNERLYRTFLQNNVVFFETQEEAFNLLIIHQNRVKHGEKSYIKPEFIPSFIDLVFWGHEHDNQITPATVAVKDGSVLITQPGSTVATSLCEGEAGEKNVGILYVKGKDCMLRPRVLQSVRPFICGELCLDDKVEPHDTAKISAYISAKMDDLLEAVKISFPKNPKLPLLRIRVKVSHPYNQNTVKREFLSRFASLVANPADVLLFSRQLRKRSKFKDEEESMQSGFDEAVTEDSIVDLFRELATDNNLHILTSDSLSNAVEEFTLKDEPLAINRYTSTVIKKTMGIYKSQAESRPDVVPEEIFSHVKRELDRTLNEEVPCAFVDSDEYWSEEDTKALIDTTSLSPMSSLSPRPSGRTPLTSPTRRGAAKVTLRKPGRISKAEAKNQKRSRSHGADSSQMSDSSLSHQTRKRRKL